MSDILHYFLLACTPVNLLWLFLGSMVGAFLGALPGMSADTGIAMFLPITFNMEPLTGLITLCAIYTSGSYGGNITGVLLNTPGTSEAMFMAMDGYPMTLQGKGNKSIGITTTAAFTGGMIGALTLLFLSPYIARFALKFGSMELFLTTMLGIVIIVGLSKDGMLKGGISACFGLLCALIGVDDFLDIPRYNFGFKELYDGMPLLPTVLGVFAVSQLLIMAAENRECVVPKDKAMKGSPWLSLAEFKRIAVATFRSGIIGTIVGIIPAASTAVAVGISYSITKKADPHPEEYGNGSERGLATTSAAHGAITGGSLVPLLTLSIPGNATAALFLGGLTIHGLAPGTKLYTTNADIVYPMMIGLVLAQFFILFVGMFGASQFAKVTAVPNNVLIPMVGCFSVLGSYVFRYLNFDMFLVLLCGVVGYYMVISHIPPAPFILAFVLGGAAETRWRRVVQLTHGHPMSLMTTTIAWVLLIINIAFLLYPFAEDIIKLLKKKV